MAGNFTPIRAFNYVAGALIVALQNNTNENELYTKLGGSMNAGTGHQHTGAVGDAPQIPWSSISGGAPPPILGNVDVYNGFDFRAFSDAGVTQLASIDGATGNAWFLGSVGVGTNTPTVKLEVVQNNVGGVAGVRVFNQDGGNVGSDAGFFASVNGAGAGDPFFMWDVNGVQAYWSAILNQTDDDWAFGAGNTPGVTPKLYYDRSADNWGVFTATPTSSFDIAKSIVGNDLTLLVRNTDNTNVNSRSVIGAITVVGGGDAFWYANDGVQDWYAGPDKSDSSRFKIGLGSTVGTNTAIQVQSASSVGVNPGLTSAVAPTFWVGATGNGLSQSGNDTYLHSDDDIFFVSGGSVVGYVDNNGHIAADGALKSTGSSDVLDTNQVATFNKINCTTTMARWSDAGGGGAPTLDQDFNISGIAYNGAGTAYYELTIDVNLFNNSYAVLATSDSGAGDQQFANVLDRQTTYYQVHIKQEGGADVTASGSSCSIGGLG